MLHRCIFINDLDNPILLWVRVLAGSPLCGRDVAVYVIDINQPSLLTPFYSVFVSISVFKALSTVFHAINPPNNSLSSHCSSCLISALLVLSAMYLFMKVYLALI